MKTETRWIGTTRRVIDAHQTKIRYLVAGGINTCFGLGIFPIMMWTIGRLGVHYLIILTICQVLGTLMAFMTNKVLVFRTKGNYLREFWRFSTFYIIYFMVNLAVLPFLVEIMRFNAIVAQLMFATGVIVFGYFWHSRVSFKPRRSH